MEYSDSVNKETSKILIRTIGATSAIAVLGVGSFFVVKDLPPGANLAGEPISDPAKASSIVDTVDKAITNRPVEIVVNDRTVDTSVGELGVSLNKALMVTQVQQYTGFSAWTKALLNGSPHVPLAMSIDNSNKLVETVALQLSVPSLDGSVAITDGQIITSDAQVGEKISSKDIQTQLRNVLEELSSKPHQEWPVPVTVNVESRDDYPNIGQELVEKVAEEARQRIEPTFVISNDANENSYSLGTDILSEMIEVKRLPQSPVEDDRLQIVAPMVLPEIPESLKTYIAQSYIPPGGNIRIENRSISPKKGSGDDVITDLSKVTGTIVGEPGTPGFLPNEELTWRETVQALVEGKHESKVLGDLVDVSNPDVLGIREPISTYTTFYTPGQSRVTNIQRIAELVNGTVIAPGQSFEINNAVGKRTTDKGFVEGGAISDGKMISDVGGGVSQFATTFFNAMWFAGVQIDTFKPHTYHFDRYPWGREATIDFPSVNLQMTNNTPYSILVEAITDGNSVTVTFWSTKYFDVEQSIGEPYKVDGGTKVRITRVAKSPDGTEDIFDRTIFYRDRPTGE